MMTLRHNEIAIALAQSRLAQFATLIILLFSFMFGCFLFLIPNFSLYRSLILNIGGATRQFLAKTQSQTIFIYIVSL